MGKLKVFFLLIVLNINGWSQEKPNFKEKLDIVNQSIEINYKNKVITLDSLLLFYSVYENDGIISISASLKDNTQYNSLIELNLVCSEIIKIFRGLNKKTIFERYKNTLNSKAEEIIFNLSIGTYSEPILFIPNRKVEKKVLLSIKYNTRLESLIFKTKYLISKIALHRAHRQHRNFLGYHFFIPKNNEIHTIASIIGKRASYPLSSKYYAIPIGRYSFRLSPNSFLNERSVILSIGDRKEYVERFFENKLYTFFHLNFKEYKDKNKLNVVRLTKEVYLSRVNGLISKNDGVWENVQLIYDVWIEDFSDQTMKINLLFILDGKYIKKRPGKEPSQNFMNSKGIDFENSIYEKQLRAFGYELYNKFEKHLKNERK
ncbi:hypothetical protein [Aquimarina macrocephali]|uniref:hypothetical protein n=1 Tax=Aquimarina macrocephali TaxID=666563 RepID=UPI0004632AFD|nr:hypothetical protein [Aquimarina macrocephali]